MSQNSEEIPNTTMYTSFLTYSQLTASRNVLLMHRTNSSTQSFVPIHPGVWIPK